MSVEAIDSVETQKQETSIIPTVFYIIASGVFLIGIVAGYQLGELKYTFLTGERNWILVIAVWIGSAISSMTFVGLGKIIELLLMIYNKKNFV